MNNQGNNPYPQGQYPNNQPPYPQMNNQTPPYPHSQMNNQSAYPQPQMNNQGQYPQMNNQGQYPHSQMNNQGQYPYPPMSKQYSSAGYQQNAGQPTIGFNVPPAQPATVTDSNPHFTGDVVYDDEAAETSGFDFTDKSIRRAFIRKVFSILMCQLLITFGFVTLVTYHEPTKEYVRQSTELFIAAFIIFIVTLIGLSCCGNLRRKSPTNFIFLFLFTFAESFFLACTASQFESEAVMMAIGVTAGVCLVLTLFALQTKWDFTAWGGVLLVVLFIAVIVGFCAIFIRSKIFSLIYSSIVALIFCVYLVFDIQIMMGGKHKYSISPEEYIFAALNLYLDIINIFMYLLYIIGLVRD